MGRKKNVKDRIEDTFLAIERLWKQTGMSPTVREIGAAIGIKSTSLIHYYIDKLVKLGRIRRGRNKTRNLFIVRPKLTGPIPARGEKMRLVPVERNVLEIPDFGPIAAGIPLHLPDASFNKRRKNYPDQAVVLVPEIYLPEGLKGERVFALHVEGDSMRDAMLTDGDIVLLQKTSIDQVKKGDIVAAWIIDTQETTLKRFEQTRRGITLRPENPNYDPIIFQPDQVDIQGKLLAVLRFRY